MDLLREEYGSDSSASTGGQDAKAGGRKPPARPPAEARAAQPNDQQGVSSTTAEPAAPDVGPSGASNKHKSSATNAAMENPGNCRTCAACRNTKARGEFSRNQLNKSVDRGRCRACVEQNCEVRPNREPSASTGWIKKADRKVSEPPAKKQKRGPQTTKPKWDPEDVEVIVRIGTQRFPFVIKGHKTVHDLKVMMGVCDWAPSFNPNYFYLVANMSKRLLSKQPISQYLGFGSTKGNKTTLDLTFNGRRHPRRVDLAEYFVSSEDLIDDFQHQKPFRCIRHSSDIRDLVGKYDVICDIRRWGAFYERNLERLFNAKMEIRHRGTDHVEGTIFGSMDLDGRDYAKFHTENSLGLDRDGPSEVEFLIDKFSSANMMHNHFISIQKHEGDDETSFDYDSDEENPNLRKGGILVLEKRAFVRRADVGIEGDFTIKEGEKLLKEYNNGFSSSFIRRHFSLPEAVLKVVYSYWREEPPPCLALEPGDVFITSMHDDIDYCAICRRSQNLRPVDSFEEWKRKEIKELSLRAPPIVVATYAFEDEFQRLEKRKRRGRK